MKELKLWIARDKDGCLFVHKHCPIRLKTCFFSNGNTLHIYEEDGYEYTSVTWKNSPKEIVIRI